MTHSDFLEWRKVTFLGTESNNVARLLDPIQDFLAPVARNSDL